MNNALDFTPDTALFKKDWLPLEQAIQKVARFEHEFGEAHLALACHAALASILTPELVNLIRINFLEPSVEWIAECDLLLSSLCQPIDQGVYEIEPQIRQVLLVALQTHLEYGAGRLEEIAHFLYRYSETDFVNELPLHIKRTYQWISGAYIDPDATIQDMFNLLKNVRAEDFMARMPDYLHIGKTLAMIANPLEMSGLQVELDDLVSTAQLSTLYWTGDKENLLSLLPENTSDLDEITHALTRPVVNWLATSEFVTSDERSFALSSIPQSTPAIESPVSTERKPVTIYCSYAYRDEELQRELAEYLAPLQAQGLITYWHDPLVPPDDVEGHKKVVDEYLNTAQIILLLISADFIASDYSYGVEMKHIMERREHGDVRVIPIILRSTYWQEAPFSNLQALPINAIPIITWEDRSLAFAEVVSGIERVVEELQTPQSLPAASMQNKMRTTIQSFEIFLAYAYEDTSFLIELENSLSSLREQGLITTWSDRQITAGIDRRQAIDIHLEQASLILLLVSPHFLMSDECSYNVQSALQHRTTYGTQVIPIIIRPCMWKEAPFASLNILPTNEKPISMWEEQSAAFANVVDGIRRAIEDPQKPQLLFDIPLPKEVQAPTQPIEIFFIYAYEDAPFVVELTNYLYPLRQQGSITIWQDSTISAGYPHETDTHLEQASFILLLVSPYFLVSDIVNHQTQKALQRYQEGKARVIPIIVRPCLWEDATFAYLQALPTDSRPITSWSNQDAAFADVANGILRAIEEPEKSHMLPEISSLKKMQTTTPPIEIFFMYVREDRSFLKRLQNHLSSLRRQGLITMWSDQDIGAGLAWEKEITRHLMRANIILLLVSPDFLASEYCYGIEMQRALERHRNGEAHIIPILVQACKWRSAPFADLQVLPTTAKPITNWNNQDEAFLDVAKGIKSVIEDLQESQALSEISSSMKMQTTTPPFEIFLIYTQADRPFLTELENSLYVLHKQGLITTWSDRDIKPGSNWRQEIDQHLMRAKIILLLVSANFLTSNYGYNVEMQRALERHRNGDARVIPVIIQPCKWNDAPFANLQALPTDSRPITYWGNRNEAFFDVVNGIKRVVEDLSIGNNKKIAAVTTKRIPNSFPDIWNVPYRYPAILTGRDNMLEQLFRGFTVEPISGTIPTQALTGLDGLGKTQTAVAYAYRYRKDYQTVLWVNAETESDLVTSFTNIAELLALPNVYVQQPESLIDSIQEWFKKTRNWLLILDNADNIALIEPFLPNFAGGHLLLTSRADTMRKFAQSHALTPLSPDDGALCLLRRASYIPWSGQLRDAPSPASVKAAQELSQLMSGLPLVLEQAGAYIETTGIGVGRYLELYKQYRPEIQQHSYGDVRNYYEAVAATLSITLEAIQFEDPAAVELLYLCAYLAPDSIPYELFPKDVRVLGPILGPIAAYPSRLDQTLSLLRKHSLLQNEADRSTDISRIFIHRLLQEALRDAMDASTQLLWVERAISVVALALPNIEWSIMQAHVQRCMAHIEHWEMDFHEANIIRQYFASDSI